MFTSVFLAFSPLFLSLKCSSSTGCSLQMNWDCTAYDKAEMSFWPLHLGMFQNKNLANVRLVLPQQATCNCVLKPNLHCFSPLGKSITVKSVVSLQSRTESPSVFLSIQTFLSHSNGPFAFGQWEWIFTHMFFPRASNHLLLPNFSKYV